MAPRHIGETLMLAVGESWRCRKRGDSGGGGAANGGAIVSGSDVLID
jgi:hypothetical protein